MLIYSVLFSDEDYVYVQSEDDGIIKNIKIPKSKFLDWQQNKIEK